MTRESTALRFAVNDLRRHTVTGAALGLVLVLSAFLMTTGAIVLERAVGSVDRLLEQTAPPHFLQMHTGEYDTGALATFAADHPEIESWFIEDMLGFDGAAIGWHRPATGESGDLSSSLIDNLFVVQNDEFDHLVDPAGQIPHPGPGEVYIPIGYQDQHGLQVGDSLDIRTDSGTHELQVRGVVRDGQMGSSLSGSIRFLISPEDFSALERAGGGVPEIIVEYRLTDPTQVSALQDAYRAEDTLPDNGPTITYQLIRLLHAFGEGLMAVVLALVSLLLIAIALLNARFVIRGTLEDEVREIGAMKAIGLPSRTIAGLYLAKFRLLSLGACAVGGGLAVAATSWAPIGAAEAPWTVMSVLLPAGALAVVYLLVLTTCRLALRRIRRIEVVSALVHASLLDQRQTARRARRQARRARRTTLTSLRGSISTRLAMIDLRAEARHWVLLPVVFGLAAVAMALPTNVLSTFESPRFYASLGVSSSDLRADIHYSDDVDRVHAQVLADMRTDDRLTDVRSYARVLYETPADGGWETLRVDVGDYSGSTVEYLNGTAPATGEIALSALNADELQTAVGDELVIRREGAASTVVVSGIYQDITSEGYTAAMTGDVTTGATGYVIEADTADGVDPATVTIDRIDAEPGATLLPTQEYADQTLAAATGAIRGVAVGAFVLSLGVAAGMTCLFLAIRLTRDRRAMGILSAVGFSTREIVGQVRLKTLLAVTTGTALGLAVAAAVGEQVIAVLLSLTGLGLAQVTLVPNPWLVYLIYPLTLIAAGYLGTVLLSARLRGADTSSWLRA
ncbi:FtsX-like permease family protein [Ruania alba]|uniref:Putative ABC transport system permease protein n=1 Tax=Ruania alba TaxID=648782 RepID=A0A1H5MXL1_9MICO|nr:FtsX-like permease family protein [Ruania alba]SEE94094.1 putative ABC transport system permease protein [Ruania alba]